MQVSYALSLDSRLLTDEVVADGERPERDAHAQALQCRRNTAGRLAMVSDDGQRRSSGIDETMHSGARSI